LKIIFDKENITMNIEKSLFDAAAWVVGIAFRRAVADPEKRRDVIFHARELIKRIGAFIDALELV